ncbi:hypothetical protein [Aquibacillus saliphilus]|uniref:hypothetical protein n=1 Tax=Aquibacillus saliphilus TaxID=1909422 RepID=UPI001CEFEBEA|nr:hypothetical protein [Aquibacillus saliphilus]
MDIKRLFKESESDKISQEIVSKIYPVEPLERYYKFGVASTLSNIEDYANTYINGKYADKLDAHDLKKIIFGIIHQDQDVKEMFGRLRNEGVQLKNEEKGECL